MVLLLPLFLLAGCSVSHQTSRKSSEPSAISPGATEDAHFEKISALQNDLADLNRQANMLEARQLAETAITYSSDLSAEYDLVRPAILHNVFVRMGIKDRGLCYHWTEDLIKRLQSLDLKTYQLHWGVAYRGSELREHNSVVITAIGEAFEKGMVLDPWRNSGDLHWALIQTDTYPWKELPPNEW
ncbi:hypothetical protein ACFL36_05630 [Thermodesulfobacteriota bacterium]